MKPGFSGDALKEAGRHKCQGGIWRMAGFACMICAGAVILSACQPTPETEAIAQKQDINEVVEQYDQQDTGTDQSIAADS